MQQESVTVNNDVVRHYTRGPFLDPPFAVAPVTFPAVGDPGYVHLLTLFPKQSLSSARSWEGQG